MMSNTSDADVSGDGKLTDHVSVGILTRIVTRSVVDEMLAEPGRVQKRTRSLPAHVVVYFVLALALFTDGYEEVIRKLVHGLRFDHGLGRPAPRSTHAGRQLR
jgi:Insertion element 4 transposase N-terminal